MPSPRVLSQTQKDWKWKYASAGVDFTLAIKDDGKLYSWGVNKFCQLGQGGTPGSPQSTPALVNVSVGIGTWKSVSAGGDFAVGIKTDGTLWSWGANDIGQLGIGRGLNESGIPYNCKPEQIIKSDGTEDVCKIIKNGTEEVCRWLAVAAGYDHALALRNDYTLWAWGWEI